MKGPDIECSKSLNGVGPGGFTCLLAGLNENTLYFARAFATNRVGTAYGENVEIRTINGRNAEVSTIAIPGIFDNEAGVRILNDGGFPLLEKGICPGTVRIHPLMIKNT